MDDGIHLEAKCGEMRGGIEIEMPSIALSGKGRSLIKPNAAHELRLGKPHLGAVKRENIAEETERFNGKGVIAMNGQIGEVEPAQENGGHRDAIVFTLFDRVRIAADLAHDENAEMRHAWIGIQARKDGDGCELADAHRDGDMDGLEAIREDTHTESAFNASCRERDGGIARLIAPRRAIAQSAVVCASV